MMDERQEMQDLLHKIAQEYYERGARAACIDPAHAIMFWLEHRPANQAFGRITSLVRPPLALVVRQPELFDNETFTDR